MTTDAQQNSSMRRVLANPQFRLLWTGQAISQIGDGLANLALLIMINKLTGSTLALGTLMVVVAIPQLIFGLTAGVFVDRWDRKKIMVISDLLRGLIVLGLMLVRRPEDVWLFYILGFFQAMVGVFFDPAKSAVVPLIVDKELLLTANSLSQTTRVVTSVIGSGLAGVLVGITGNGNLAFSLDAASFFISAIFIFRMQIPAMAGLASGGLRQTLEQLNDGLRYLFSHRPLVAVMTTFAVTMLGIGAVNVLFVPFLSNILRIPTEALGVVDAAQVVGMVLGGSLVAVLAARLKTSQIITFGICLVGLMIALIGFSTSIWMVMASVFMVGLFLTPVQASASTILQTSITNEQRGRAGAALNTVITLASVISMACAGILGEWLGIRQVFFLSGSIAVAAGLFAIPMLKDQASQPNKTKAIDEDPGQVIG